MIILQLIQIQRIIILGMLPLLFLLFLEIPLSAQDKPKEEIHATNVKWTTKGDVITIKYDLNGSVDKKYMVSTIMKRENDSTFSTVPYTVEGDIGEGYFAGTSRAIRWYFRRDYPRGFQGEGYYFEIQVKAIEQQSTWIYYAVGAVAVTGGVVALLVSRHQNSTRPIIELPYPPPRP